MLWGRCLQAQNITGIAVSAIVPMLGNLALAFFLDRARRLLQSPKAIARLNFGSGVLLILVGLVIPFT